MKKSILAIAAAFLLTGTIYAQSPERMSYQAVVRNAENNLVASETVGMQISIIQGTVGGDAVYVETHTPSTNANGLVSLAIGNGTVVSGDFATIDWADGPYFIKTETDPEGGTSYSIEGTSQLMSVPYAFHATTAESITGTIEETDPVFEESVASDITEEDIDNWNAHTDSAAIAEMGYVAGLKTYEVGDFAHGGIVFWVDETGQHGLVVAKNDIGLYRWYAGTNVDTRAGNGIYSGKDNAQMIYTSHLVLGDDGDTYAALECLDFETTEDDVTYGDWYLPSEDEFLIIGDNFDAINTTATANGGSALNLSPYWTSTEESSILAKAVLFSFGGGSSSMNTGKVVNFNVRAIRSF